MTFKRKDFVEKPSKLEQRRRAQDLILHHAIGAFYDLADKSACDDEYEALQQQISRIEVLFGYEPGTWKA